MNGMASTVRLRRRDTGAEIEVRIVSCTARMLVVRHAGRETAFDRRDGRVVWGDASWELHPGDLVWYRAGQNRYDDTSHF